MEYKLLKIRSLILLFLFWITIFKEILISTNNCDKVANIPPDFELLLPNYQKLNRFHLHNYFFLETEHPESITINIRERSVFKFLAIPKLADMDLELFLPNGQKVLLNAYDDIPIDYVNFNLDSGIVKITFSYRNPGENLKTNKICNSPFFQFEVLLENQRNFQQRNQRIRKDVGNLDDFQTAFEDAFEKVSQSENLPLFLDYDSYRLSIKEKTEYKSYNVSVIAEFDLNIEDKEHIINSNSENFTHFKQDQAADDTQNQKVISKKYLIDFNLYTDFLYGGSLFLALVRREDIEKGELANHKCLFNEKCVLAERQNKNQIFLQSIVTPGKYKIILFNFLADDKYAELKKQILEIPVSAKLEIKNFVKEENRYNCPGRHLPSHLFFLKDKYSNDYLEYSGDIIMNTEKLYDEMTFFVEEDSLLRIAAFAHSGENIDLELYHIPQVGSEFENLIKINNSELNKSLNTNNPLGSILSKIFSKKKQKEAESAQGQLKQISEHFGQSDGMYLPLMKGNTYKVVFSYKNSMFAETEKKNCEMFYLKIALGKISHVKSIFPNAYSNTCPGANDNSKKTEIKKILKDFETENSSSSPNTDKAVYDSFSRGFNSVFRAFFDRNNPSKALFSAKFQVKNPVNINVEILSDFLSSFIVPVIIPDESPNSNSSAANDDNSEADLNVQQILNHKHNLITFHENHIKLNLQKGVYRLLIINGLSQFYNEDDVVENSRLLDFMDLEKIPKCLEFQVRFSAQKVLNSRMANWECNGKDFEFLPSSLNNLLHLGAESRLKPKYSYFSKHLLVPLEPQTMRLKTAKEGFLLRLIHEFTDMEGENNGNEGSSGLLRVSLSKNKKVLKTSNPLIVENEMKTAQQYITHYLKPNTEYELVFEFESTNKHFDYFANCKLFKMEISLLSEKLINGETNNNNSNFEKSCAINIPKTEEIAYERIIGLTSSFFRYGSKSILQMFLSKTIFGSAAHLENKANSQDEMDLEISHPTSSQIQFLFDPKSHKPFSYSYNFEVRSSLARVTISVDNPYASVMGISFKLFFMYDGIEELVAVEDMDEQGFFSIKGVQLEIGKYRVEFYANNLVDIKKDFSVYKNNFANRQICVSFYAHILIENRPFDFFSKHVSENYLSCPYNSLPEDLNIPGWLAKDTGYNLNLFGKFKINPNESKMKFRIYETSLFKFHIPEEHENIFNYIDLYKLSGNSKKKIKEKLESKDNYVNLVLEKGLYQVDFTFRGVQDSKLNEDKKCMFFEAQLLINPVSNTLGNLFDKNNSNNILCNQNLISNFEHNAYKQYIKMQFLNEKTEEEEKINHVIKLDKSRRKGNFIAEIIQNPYLDTNFKIKVFEKQNSIDSGSDSESWLNREHPAEIIYHENIIWLFFHSDPHSEYFIKLIAESFDNLSVCSSLTLSYSHTENQKDSEVNENKQTEILNDNKDEIKNENFKKNNCKIHDHLPAFLFTEKNSKTNTALKKYGGPQAADGLVDIYGEFLLPADSTETRTTFYVPTASMIYVKIIPKYAKEANVYIEVYRDKNIIYRYSHNDYMGVLLYHLEPSKSPYILNLTFDKSLEDVPCGSYELLLSVVPKEMYRSDYLGCDSADEKLMDSLIIDKPQAGEISTHLKAENDEFNLMKKDKEGNLVKKIKLELKHSYAVMLMLQYIDSDNYLEISLEDSDSDLQSNSNYDADSNSNVLEIGQAKHSIYSENSGILTKKVIAVNLKKGSYVVKITFHKMFRNMLKRTFKKDLEDLCLNFQFEWEFSELHIKKDLEKTNTNNSLDDQSDDDLNSEIDLNHIAKSDKTDPDIISVLAVEPPVKKNIKIGKKFEVEIKFSQAIDLDKQYANQDFLDFCYLEDPETKAKIYPYAADDLESDLFKFSFSAKNMRNKKCYLLKLSSNENPYYKKFLDDGLEHKFCTEKCDCNIFSSYKCGKNGECICHFPYMGPKCEQCAPSYLLVNGKCEEVLINCDEAVNCSGHGKCVADTNFINVNSSAKTCQCDSGFASYSHEKNIFCNTCANPKKNWPYCVDKNEAQNGSGDGLLADSNTPCEDYPTLPKKLFNEFEDEERDGNTQEIDGSINLSEIFKVNSDEEATEISIPENSVVRIFYHSFEVNNAKVLVLENKYDENPIAFSDGKEKTESFIARLAKKNTPYVIKILHFNLKNSCNKYKLRIGIMPIYQVMSHLKCSSVLSSQDPFGLLPQQSLILQANPSNPSESSKVEFADKEYFIAENLILDFAQMEKQEEQENLNNENDFNTQNAVYSYSNTGMLSKAKVDEPFIYNVKLDVRNSFTFAISANYDFLTSDINIALRDSAGKVLQYGKWAVQDDVNYEDSMLIRNEIQHLVDPGIYYLTIKQNIPANHLLQIINDSRIKRKKKSSNNHKLCFGFYLNLQYNLINKPDQGVNTAKYESMFNRILDVSPTNISNIRVDKKFKILVEFEDPILNKLRESGKTLKDVFYFENTRDRSKIRASNIYLQGGLQKAFLILFEKHSLPKDECFELVYNLDLLISEDKDKKILSDKPLLHKYCSKSCNCNPHTHFLCGENGECQCEEPYTGKGCFECVEGYVMVNFKCISQENCDKNFCSGHGKCLPKSFNQNVLQGSNNGESIKEFIYPSCQCEANFAGNADCSACANQHLTFPDCELIKINSQIYADKKEFESKNHKDDYNKISKLDKKDFADLQKEDAEELNIESENAGVEAKCSFPFIPFNLDSLGYLHLEGKLHLARKYSFKHFVGSHYSTSFTIKTRSHLKIHLEHSKSSHIISIFLLNNKEDLVENGELFTGPAGLGSASYLDLFLDPLYENGNLQSYKINFYIKDVLENDETDADKNLEDKETLKDECFNAFLELAIFPAADESALIAQRDKACPKTERLPYLIGDGSSTENKLFDYHTIFYENLKKEITKYSYIRDEKKYNLTDVVYFYHDYFYVPDHLDQELVLEIQILSDFLNSQIGLLLEIVELPLNLKVDHKKITSQNLKNLFADVKSPVCEVHCFTAVKKENSVLLSRMLPSDTYFRIWFYDVNPVPIKANVNTGELNKCVEFEMLFDIKSVKASNQVLNDKREIAICQNDPLPSNLNLKGYLGDSKYIEKWGFHILDSFRVDDSIFTGLVHETHFEIKEFHLLRLVVFHGRIDTDIELFYKQTQGGNDFILLARSNAKNFEDVIVVEIPPGQYKIVFKFFPPSSGFHKCEAIRLEFSMNNFRLLQENINRLVAKHKNKPVFNKINLVDLVRNEKDLFSRDFAANRYTTQLAKAFFIDKEDVNNFEPSVVLAEMSFSIEAADDSKLELYALAQSDFLYLDAGWYLTEVSSKKIVTAVHKKNMNVLSTGPLEAGTYVLTLRYYRRLHSNNFSSEIKDVQLLKAEFAELDVNLSFINRDSDSVSVLTNDGYIKVAARGQKHVSHNWLCRNKGIPIPKSLDNLRYLEFKTDMHILDNFLVPTSGDAEEIIKFRLKYSEKMMLRVYIECHFIDIDIQLRELVKNNDYKILAESKQDVFFETVMALIKDNTEYEIVLIFKGSNTMSQEDNLYSNSNCQTFKMEIALEANHNYACPESDKYAQLTDLKIFPAALPLKENKIFSYDSRKHFLGEDKDSGYLYMIRKDYDVEVKFSELNVESEIDFKLEILHDFMQSPLNIFLVREQNDDDLDVETASDKGRNKNAMANLQANILKYSGIDNSAILDFGEIFENRSSLIVKNLPAGKYAVYLYLPALKTTFLSESRVCAIYDVIAEAKKSRGHFKEKEIASTAQIKDDNLDIPAKLPLTLNSLNMLETSKYVNNHDFYYVRRNTTNSEKEIVNNIKFTLEEESLCEFSVEHDLHGEKIFIKIEHETEFKKEVIKILPKGNYELSIKLDNVDSKNYLYDSLNHLMLLFIGISPVSRVKEIYSYNNLLSTYHQCQTSALPAMLKYNTKSKSFFYHIDDFKFNVKDLSRTVSNNGITTLGKMNIALNSKKNRILIEIGSDLLLNNLSVAVVSESKKWESAVYKNNGFLDVVVPKGKYAIELQLLSPIAVREWECIVFSLDVHVIDLDNVLDTKTHFKKHIFDSSKSKEDSKRLFLQPKCNGEILPIRISHNSENENSKIDYEGEYNIHLNSALYFDSHQVSKYNENLNEIALNLKHDSLVRVTIYNLRPKNFVVVPKLKQKSLAGGDKGQNPILSVVKENILIRENIELISHNKKERNIAWFVEKNNFDSNLLSSNSDLNANNDDYLLQLERETGDKFTDAHNSGACPIYGLDISVNSLQNLSKKFACPLENGKVLKYILPQDKITKEKFRENSYHEIIDFSYITESQYSEIYAKNKQFDGFEYKVDFELNEESHLNFELGYDNSISLFDGYVVQYDLDDYTKSHVIATSDVYFNKAAGTLLYRRIINTTLGKGKYSIIIMESIWSELSRDIRSYSGIDNHLCVPFEYKLDIVSLNQKNAKPEIYSVFPPGTFLFKAKDEDINIRVSLSKSPFTHQHKQITNVDNFMNIVEAFYFKIVPNKNSVLNSNNNNNANANQNNETGEDHEIRIYPDKVYGSTDGKSWDLFFLSTNFENDKSYKLDFDDNWIFDSNYSKFIVNVVFPTFRIETKKEEIFAMADNIGKKKDEIKEKDKTNLQEEQPLPAPPTPPSNLGNNKCGEHGKLIYDNILKRYHCSCLHGYTGKYCKVCEGKVNPVTKICEIDEEDYDDEKADNSPVDIGALDRRNYDTTTETYHDTPTYSTPDKNKGDNPNNNGPALSCVHGIYDANLGKCICEVGYTGRYCENMKSSTIKKEAQNPPTSEESIIWTILDKIVKLIIGVILLLVFWVLYKCTRRSSTSKQEYQNLPTVEFEMGSEYRTSKLELENPESNTLFDYEIKPDKKKKKPTKVENSINSTEL